MKKKFDFKGMRFNIWFYFVMYAFLIVGVLWLFQIVFLEPFYENYKRREVVHVGEKLFSEYGNENYDELVADAVMQFGVSVCIFDENAGTMYGQVVSGRDLEKFLFQIEASQSGKVDYVDADDEGQKMLVYGVKGKDATGKTVYFYMRTMLAPVATVQWVLQRQLGIVTGVLLVLGAIISFFMSKYLGKPISTINREAKKLASGNYDVQFNGEGYTECEELAGTLNYAASELKKNDELRKELMANVSHDLRTPLTMVKAYAEMIRDISGDNPLKREQHTKVIIEESDRLSLLVNDILNLSRLERGGIPLEPIRLNLSDKVNRVMEHFSVFSEGQGYRFEVSVQPELFVMADEARMEQVIYNLVSNAINYTGEDKLVQVRLFASGENVRFEVQDSGAGIPKEQLKTIWDRYYRSKETHKRPVVGTGLGLSIVKNLLQLHQARFGVQSELNEGSIFWFELPISAQPPQ